MTTEMYEKAIEKIVRTLSSYADREADHLHGDTGCTDGYKEHAGGRCFAYNDAVWEIRNTIRLAKEGLLK